MRYRALISIACAVIALTGCGPSEAQIQATVEAAVTGTQAAIADATATAEADSCSDAALVAYADDVEQLLDRYEAQTEVTGSTPRVSLGGPLQRLVDYEDEVRELVVPDCLEQFHEALGVMMQRFRQGYQTFAAQGDTLTINQALTDGRQLMADLRGALPSIREGVLPGDIAIPQ